MLKQKVMTVAELIKELEKMPQDAKVMLGVHVKGPLRAFYAKAEDVEVNKYNNNQVHIKGYC